MKRKRLDRDTWGDIIESRYFQTEINEPGFHGAASLLFIDKAKLTRIWRLLDGESAVIANGYTWLQLLSFEGSWSAIISYDEKGDFKVCYIDIIDGFGLCGDNVYWFDDIYLDIIVSPKHMIYEADMDEMLYAQKSGDITKAQFDKAVNTAKTLKEGELKDVQAFLCRCKQYFMIIKNMYDSI